jgi:hypothetical protein
VGDLRQPWPGLTRSEGRLPQPWLRRTLAELGFEVIHQALCLYRLTNLFALKTSRSISANRAVALRDDLLRPLTASRPAYHATTRLEKLRPTNAFMVLRAVPSRGHDRAR